jgi:hypothetical protein
VPATPDRFPGEADEEGIRLEDVGADPAVIGEIRRNGSDIKAKDGAGVFNLRSGSGLTESQHKTLLQLIHFIDGGPAEGFTTGATRTTTGTAFPSQILWKRADSTNLVEKNLTYSGAFPTTIEWKIYDTDGSTVLATVTDTISYSGAFETGRTRAIA